VILSLDLHSVYDIHGGNVVGLSPAVGSFGVNIFNSIKERRESSSYMD
jgi:hypothetical protein